MRNCSITVNSDVVLGDAVLVVLAHVLVDVEAESHLAVGSERGANAVLDAAEARLATDARRVAGTIYVRKFCYYDK